MDEKQELLEIYKLHTELADRLNKQRTSTNRFYLLIMSGLFGLCMGLLRRDEAFTMVVLMISFGVLGASLAVAWYMQIRAYYLLNLSKLQSLQELEAKLAHQFFKREWALLDDGEEEDANKYAKLIFAEAFAPGAFFAVFVALFIVGSYFLFPALIP